MHSANRIIEVMLASDRRVADCAERVAREIVPPKGNIEVVEVPSRFGNHVNVNVLDPYRTVRPERVQSTAAQIEQSLTQLGFQHVSVSNMILNTLSGHKLRFDVRAWD